MLKFFFLYFFTFFIVGQYIIRYRTTLFLICLIGIEDIDFFCVFTYMFYVTCSYLKSKPIKIYHRVTQKGEGAIGGFDNSILITCSRCMYIVYTPLVAANIMRK